MTLARRPIDKESVLLHILLLQNLFRLILVRNFAIFKRHRLKVVGHIIQHEELAFAIIGLAFSLLALVLREHVTELAAGTRLDNAHFEPLPLFRPDGCRRHEHIDMVELLLLAVFVRFAGHLKQLSQVVVGG